MPVLNQDLDQLLHRAATKYPDQPDKEACWLRLASRLKCLSSFASGVSLDWHLMDKPAPDTTFLTGKGDETIK